MMGPRRVDGGAGLSPNSRRLSTTQSVVLGIVRPPGEPVTIWTWPSLSTSVGVCELSIRLCGAIRLAGVPIRPAVSVRPGIRLKSPISLLSKKPGAGDHALGAVGVFERVRQRDGVARLVDAERCVVWSPSAGQDRKRGELSAGRGALADRARELVGVGLRRQLVDRDRRRSRGRRACRPA